jgi:hypothetical protein
VVQQQKQQLQQVHKCSRWTELCCDRAVMSEVVVFKVICSETGVCVAFICLGRHLWAVPDNECAHSTCQGAAPAFCRFKHIIISSNNHYVSRKARACAHATSSGALPRKHTDFAYVYIRLRMSHTYIYVYHFHKHTFWPIPTSMTSLGSAAHLSHILLHQLAANNPDETGICAVRNCSRQQRLACA